MKGRVLIIMINGDGGAIAFVCVRKIYRNLRGRNCPICSRTCPPVRMTGNHYLVFETKTRNTVFVHEINLNKIVITG